MDLSKYKWIVFDLDDTLIPGSLHNQAWNYCLEKLSIDRELFKEQYNKTVYSYDDHSHGSFSSGRKLQTTLEAMKIENFVSVTDKLLKHFRAYYRGSIKNYIKNDPHNTFKFLQKLRQDKSLAILSNNSLDTKFEYQRIFYSFYEDILFQHLIVSEEIGIRKPNPEIFKYLMQKLECDRSEVLFIGDKPEGDGKSIDSGIDFIHLYGHRANMKQGTHLKQIKYLSELNNVDW